MGIRTKGERYYCRTNGCRAEITSRRSLRPARGGMRDVSKMAKHALSRDWKSTVGPVPKSRSTPRYGLVCAPSAGSLRAPGCPHLGQEGVRVLRTQLGRMQELLGSSFAGPYPGIS